MHRILLIATVLFCLPYLAFAQDNNNHKAQIISPETPQSWSYGTMTRHSLVWNAKKNVLRADLTFSDEEYNDDTAPSLNRETYQCPFPEVTFDAQKKLFFAKSAKGFPVPVAKQSDTIFGPQIDLLPTSRVEIFNFHGRLIVVLSGTTNQAFATGTNKWIVRPQGWYLQNLF